MVRRGDQVGRAQEAPVRLEALARLEVLPAGAMAGGRGAHQVGRPAGIRQTETVTPRLKASSRMSPGCLSG